MARLGVSKFLAWRYNTQMTDGDGIFGLSPLRDLLINMPDKTLETLIEIVNEFISQHEVNPLSQITVLSDGDKNRKTILFFFSQKLDKGLDAEGNLTLDLAHYEAQENYINPLNRLKQTAQKVLENKTFNNKNYKKMPNVDLVSLLPSSDNKKYKALYEMAKLFGERHKVSNYLLGRCITPTMEGKRYSKAIYEHSNDMDAKIKNRLKVLNKHISPNYFIHFRYKESFLEIKE